MNRLETGALSYHWQLQSRQFTHKAPICSESIQLPLASYLGTGHTAVSRSRSQVSLVWVRVTTGSGFHIRAYTVTANPWWRLWCVLCCLCAAVTLCMLVLPQLGSSTVAGLSCTAMSWLLSRALRVKYVCHAQKQKTNFALASILLVGLSAVYLDYLRSCLHWLVTNLVSID